MLRNRLNDSLKVALRAKDNRATSTLRLILAALKDRDIAARGKGNSDGLGEEDILGLLQTMIKQRREAIGLYEQGGGRDLAEQEAEEIAIIEGFLPEQLSEDEIAGSVREVIGEIGAITIMDMGKVMALLRERYNGKMDFAKASAIAKSQLD